MTPYDIDTIADSSSDLKTKLETYLQIDRAVGGNVVEGASKLRPLPHIVFGNVKPVTRWGRGEGFDKGLLALEHRVGKTPFRFADYRDYLFSIFSLPVKSQL